MTFNLSMTLYGYTPSTHTPRYPPLLGLLVRDAKHKHTTATVAVGQRTAYPGFFIGIEAPFSFLELELLVFLSCQQIIDGQWLVEQCSFPFSFEIIMFTP